MDKLEHATPYLNTLPGRLLRSVHVDERVICLFCMYLFMYGLVPVAARSKAWVCGRSTAGIVGSSTALGMAVCLVVNCGV